VALFDRFTARMVQLPGMLLARLLPFLIRLLNLAIIKLPWVSLIGEQLWNWNIKHCFVMRLGLLFLHRLG
jgi:predicted small integral membrane protein